MNEILAQTELRGDLGAVLVDELGEPIGPVNTGRGDPAQVVQPDVVELEPIGSTPRSSASERWRVIATLQSPIARYPRSTSAWVTMPTGFVKVDNPGPGRRGQLRELEDHRHRPQGLGEAARAGGLLADRAVAEGERLVEQACRLTADAELDEDERGAVDRGARVIGQGQPTVPAEAGEHAAREPADEIETLRLMSWSTSSSIGRRSFRLARPSMSSGV